MKKMSILIFILISLVCKAPVYTPLYIMEVAVIQPYEKIWKATCLVESKNDSMAYHLESNGLPAVGIAQIMQVRVDDYNKLTGKNYKLSDMYIPVIAKKVFIYYAVQIGWENPERISREWNGGEHGMKIKQTIVYWQKIKAVLQKV